MTTNIDVLNVPTSTVTNELAYRVNLSSLPDVLHPRDISSVLGVGYAKSLHLIKHGGIIHIKAGNVYLVSKVRFIEWLDADRTRIIDVD